MVIATVLGHQSPWQDSTMWKLSNISFSEINANKLSLLILFFVTQPLIWPRASRWTYSQLHPCRCWWETTMARLSSIDHFATLWVGAPQASTLIIGPHETGKFCLARIAMYSGKNSRERFSPYSLFPRFYLPSYPLVVCAPNIAGWSTPTG